MTKTVFIYILTVFFSVGTGAAAITDTRPPRNKKIVLIKPATPHVKVYKPLNIKEGYVWIDGHWQWNKKANNYIWVRGHLVKRKNNKVWVSGCWKPVKGGWIYRPGKWA